MEKFVGGFWKKKVLLCGALPTTKATEEKFRDENITVYWNFNLIYILISNFRMSTLTRKGLEVESEVDVAQMMGGGDLCDLTLG